MRPWSLWQAFTVWIQIWKICRFHCEILICTLWSTSNTYLNQMYFLKEGQEQWFVFGKKKTSKILNYISTAKIKSNFIKKGYWSQENVPMHKCVYFKSFVNLTWIRYIYFCFVSQEALLKFGDRRTNWEKGKQFQGVETPSQSRFVGYYDIITNKLGGLLPSIKTIHLKKIRIHSIKGFYFNLTTNIPHKILFLKGDYLLKLN